MKSVDVVPDNLAGEAVFVGYAQCFRRNFGAPVTYEAACAPDLLDGAAGKNGSQQQYRHTESGPQADDVGIPCYQQRQRNQGSCQVPVQH